MREILLPARLRRDAGRVVAGDLSGGKHMIAERERLAVMREWPRGGGLYDLLLKPGTRHVADKVDLDQRILDQQARAADGGARRRHLEVSFPHRIKAVEIVEVGEKHLRLDRVVERGTGRFESFFQ